METRAAGVLHHNPVHQGYFADPFAWEHEGTYYAVGTGEAEAEGRTGDRVFPLLRSGDFVRWEPTGRAMNRPPSTLGNNFWAPEVAFEAGKFYLYYSVGFGDKQHQLRVAVATAPEGPYEDAGVSLIPPERCSFAIDPHPFRDRDGHWYLFFAKDFLECAEGERPGTALAFCRMESMTQLAPGETTVLRATMDWQRFEKDRPMYGGIWDWHTLEGPTVRYRNGKYYCFYSGGRWENSTYGVDYGVADKVTGPYRCDPHQSGPRVLRTTSSSVIGPGHNSILKGPDGSDYIVYHAWDREMKARRMMIDKLDWLPEGPRCAGPSLGGTLV